MKITFLGASENVTGSRFLLESGNQRILIDCGMFQERDFRERNWEGFPINPAHIQSVLLTHAHIDHCGYLPKLIKEGFKGGIYCTAPTADITKVSLLDSAKLQEADAEFKRWRHKKEGRKGKYPEVPLYTVDDAKMVFNHFHKISYEQKIKVAEDIQATFYAAGHILGAAMIELEVKEDNAVKRIVFSGDIGRWDRPILNDPHIFDRADYVVMEATYGDRLHDGGDDCLHKLKEVIVSTKERGGNIVIPTFAIGRTQELLYDLNCLLKEDQIPHLLTFVDSPMAIGITEIFEQYPEYFDEEAQELMVRYKDLFDFPLLKMTATSQESKGINHIRGTAIIMAGSGMCTGGRIKHHLVNNISRPESTILFVGYQALGTLGRTILERPTEVRILGQVRPVKARIAKINGFSAHADRDELIRWVAGIKQAPQKVFIVHSEKNVAAQFASLLREKLGSEIVVPKYKDEVVI